MLRGPTIFTALAALLGSSTGSAKPSDDRRAVERRAALESLADCYLRADGKNIERVLLADPQTGEFQRWAGKYKTDIAACWTHVLKKHQVWLENEGEVVRYALAEGILRRRPEGVALTDLDRVAPLSQGLPKKPTTFDRAALYLSVLSECVLRANAETSRRLLSSKASSPEEGKAFSELTPAISGCVDQSQNVSLDRESFRGALALNYLRLARAPRQSAPIPAGAEK